jgi:hypothetical protein
MIGHSRRLKRRSERNKIGSWKIMLSEILDS